VTEKDTALYHRLGKHGGENMFGYHYMHPPDREVWRRSTSQARATINSTLKQVDKLDASARKNSTGPFCFEGMRINLLSLDMQSL